ncbi:twinfilin-1 isoform X2 [Anabrus simplex]|uniref:twinfilin-1 isoform X2 n=1 Tax=Anabrus simplex TaxID=316456 RepID=UPI0035A281DD
MSHQTGIRANDALKKFFGKCRDGSVRVFKVSIVDEELTLASFKEAVGSWEDDYDDQVIPMIEDGQPAYILYRLDSKNTSGYEWLFISWSPDNSPIRQKMLYASTKATLKQEFGSGQIKEELHGIVPDDITLHGFQRYKNAAVGPAPLTVAEEELAELKRCEVGVGVDTRHQTLSGVAFPMTSTAVEAIRGLAIDCHNYVQLKIDLEREIINVECACIVSIENLPEKVPTTNARYHLYRFKHTHEGDYLESVVFIYSMPGYTCSIKERMLYSSCKNPLLYTIESELGLFISKKVIGDSRRYEKACCVIFFWKPGQASCMKERS